MPSLKEGGNYCCQFEELGNDFPLDFITPSSVAQAGSEIICTYGERDGILCHRQGEELPWSCYSHKGILDALSPFRNK